MQRDFYTEAFLHKAEPHEISPREEAMIRSMGFFAPRDAGNPGLPVVTYDRRTPDGLMHFTVDGAKEARTREQVLNLIDKLMMIGTVPRVCIDALRDIQKHDVTARQEKAPAVTHEDNVVYLPVHEKEHRPHIRLAMGAFQTAGL